MMECVLVERAISQLALVPLLEEHISGTETCSYEGFEFRAALFLIDDIICAPLSLLHMQDIYLPTA